MWRDEKDWKMVYALSNQLIKHMHWNRNRTDVNSKDLIHVNEIEIADNICDIKKIKNITRIKNLSKLCIICNTYVNRVILHKDDTTIY